MKKPHLFGRTRAAIARARERGWVPPPAQPSPIAKKESKPAPAVEKMPDAAANASDNR